MHWIVVGVLWRPLTDTSVEMYGEVERQPMPLHRVREDRGRVMKALERVHRGEGE